MELRLLGDKNICFTDFNAGALFVIHAASTFPYHLTG
jgi:hypothetical protein